MLCTQSPDICPGVLSEDRSSRQTKGSTKHSLWIQAVCVSLRIGSFDIFTVFVKHPHRLYNQRKTGIWDLFKGPPHCFYTSSLLFLSLGFCSACKKQLIIWCNINILCHLWLLRGSFGLEPEFLSGMWSLKQQPETSCNGRFWLCCDDSCVILVILVWILETYQLTGQQPNQCQIQYLIFTHMWPSPMTWPPAWTERNWIFYGIYPKYVNSSHFQVFVRVSPAVFRHLQSGFFQHLPPLLCSLLPATVLTDAERSTDGHVTRADDRMCCDLLHLFYFLGSKTL